MNRGYDRKTIDCYKFYVKSGNGWMHVSTEYSRGGMKKQRQTYERNKILIRIKRGRVPITPENRRFLGKFYT